MAKILEDISRTFNEFLLLPNLTDERCIPSQVSLRTPLVKYKKGEEAKILCKCTNGISNNAIRFRRRNGDCTCKRRRSCIYIWFTISIESQAKMVRHVKKHKAGFITSDSNVKSGTPLKTGN